MLLKSLQNRPLFQYVFLVLLSFTLWGGAFFNGGFGDWQVWVSWIWTLAAAIGFGMIIRHQQLVRDSGIPAIFFLCLASVHAQRAFTMGLWLYPLTLLVLYYILSIYGKERSYPSIFNMTFFWSIITILQPELFFTIPCIFIILIAYSQNNWREWVCALLGIVSAYILYLGYAFFLNRDALPQWQNWLVLGFLPLEKGLVLPYVLTGLCAILSFISILSFREYLQDLEIAERHKSSALACMFFYFLIFFACSNISLQARILLFFPPAFFVSKFLLKLRKAYLRDIFFLAIVALAAVQAYL